MSKQKEFPSDSAKSSGEYEIMRDKDANFITLLKTEIISKTVSNETNSVQFPTFGLPKIILDFSNEISEVYGVPCEFPALAALCAVSASIRKKLCVDSGKFKNFPQLWLQFVSPPGVGKTEPAVAAFRPLLKLEKLSYDQYQIEYNQWKVECIDAKKIKENEPQKPTYYQCLVDDFTPESLYQTMFRNDGAITLYRDELSGWFADFGRYGKSGEISRYLSIFNNTQFCINRKSEEPLQIAEPFMSICGTIQPEVLNDILSNNNLKENGFASRFLYVYPSNIKKQKYSEKTPNISITERYEELIKHCYYLPKFEQPLTLSPEAKRLFIDYADLITDMVNNCPENFLRATYSKMEIQVLRISLIIQIIRGIYNNIEWQKSMISKEAMYYSIELCKFFTCNVQRINNTDNSIKMSVVEAIKTIHKTYEIKNKQMFADAIGVKRQYISKICNQ